jgi:hypothetical protein
MATFKTVAILAMNGHLRGDVAAVHLARHSRAETLSRQRRQRNSDAEVVMETGAAERAGAGCHFGRNLLVCANINARFICFSNSKVARSTKRGRRDVADSREILQCNRGARHAMLLVRGHLATFWGQFEVKLSENAAFSNAQFDDPMGPTPAKSAGRDGLFVSAPAWSSHGGQAIRAPQRDAGVGDRL